MFFDRYNSNFTYGRKEWANNLSNSKLKNTQHKTCGLGVVGITFIIHMLLICAGIHPNPGPNRTDDHRTISICHANIRSLKHIDKFGIRDKLLHIKCGLANHFKIITLSETWLSRCDSSDDYIIPGYQKPFRRDREQIVGKIGYGGVLAWVSDKIACKRRLDLELPNIEALWLEIRSDNKKFFLCVTYRAPTISNEYWDTLQINVNMVQELGAKIIIVGDLNADPGTPEGTKLLRFSEANNLTVHVKEPTRVTQVSKTILDQFLSNIPHMVGPVSISPPVSTNDHSTIAVIINFRTPKVNSYTRLMWDFKNANFDIYRNAISSVNWQDLFHNRIDIDEVTEVWTSTVLDIAKHTIPNKIVTIRPSDKPWYSNPLRLLCRKKDRYYKRAKQINSPELWEKYKQA